MTEAAVPLLYEKSGAIATFTLNRPAARNALTPELVCRLADALRDFAADPELRVGILTGQGDKAFCAGSDLATMLPLISGDRAAADEWDRRVLEEPFVMAASSLRDYPLDKPLIAAVNGACLAGGMEMLLGTDIRIAARSASFGLPEVCRGLFASGGSTVRLPRQIPFIHAMDILLTGRRISADEALSMNIVNKVVPDDELMTTARDYARMIAANSPFAVQQTKRSVMEGLGMERDAAFDSEQAIGSDVFGHVDAREGPLAFVEKRAAVWSDE